MKTRKVKCNTNSLECTLFVIASVCLYATDHFICGSVCAFFAIVIADGSSKKKKEVRDVQPEPVREK